MNYEHIEAIVEWSGIGLVLAFILSTILCNTVFYTDGFYL